MKIKQISSVVAVLISKSGRPYLGCDIPRHYMEEYLEEFSKILPSDFQHFRNSQIARDGGKFHVTVISPPEFSQIGDHSSVTGEVVIVQLSGIGCAASGAIRTFFVVASCSRIQEMRRSMGLPSRDLHITIGFDSRDVHNVTKDMTSLL